MKKAIIILILPFFVFLMIVMGVAGIDSDDSNENDSGASNVQGMPNCIKEEMVVASLEIQAKYGYPASVCLAQIIQESSGSNDGLSGLAYNHKNLFGIKKGRNWQGKTVDLTTKEQKYDGSIITIVATFRKYDSWTESINDRAELLKRAYDVDGITNADEFADKLKKWATDLDYPETLKSHMKKYDLYQFDSMTVDEFKANASVILATGGSKIGNAIANTALSKKGCKYEYGANGPNTFDCSGLVWFACRQNGIDFERTSAQNLSKMGKEINYENLQTGDIITFKTDGKSVSHVGIYIGNGQMIHAPHTGDVVKISSLDGYYKKVMYNCRRLY